MSEARSLSNDFELWDGEVSGESLGGVPHAVQMMAGRTVVQYYGEMDSVDYSAYDNRVTFASAL